MPPILRAANAGDEIDIINVARSTDMFEPDELTFFTERIRAHFRGDTQGGSWRVLDEDGVIGAAYLAPEAMAQDVWNLLFIGLLPESRARHGGTRLLGVVEESVAQKGARLLLVETSGSEAFAPARAFYLRNGYEQEARIRDFYMDGDDKIIFRKAFPPAAGMV